MLINSFVFYSVQAQLWYSLVIGYGRTAFFEKLERPVWFGYYVILFVVSNTIVSGALFVNLLHIISEIRRVCRDAVVMFFR